MKNDTVKPEPASPQKPAPTVTPMKATSPVTPMKSAPPASPSKPAPVSSFKAEPVSPLKTQPVMATPVAPAPVTPVPAKAAKPTAARISLELVKPEARQVCVAGSFNGWKPEKTPLVRAGNGRWIGNLAITPGKHEYLFVVDGEWLPDPNAKESVQNPFGGRNSVLTASV